MAHGHVITDPGSFYLEVIAPELIMLWIMEDLQIGRAAAEAILASPVATRLWQASPRRGFCAESGPASQFYPFQHLECGRGSGFTAGEKAAATKPALDLQ